MNILQVPLQLRELWISVAHLFKIPKSIVQLKHLERMLVTSRSYSMIGILEIPKEFCDLRSLKHLVLQITNMSSLPDSFGNLSTLQHIDLSYCSHLERLPNSFGNLSRLEHIDLSGCGALERLPDSLGNLSRLQHINLSDCFHLERLPDSFGNLSMLEHIDLSCCTVSERFLESFGNLNMLEHVNLSHLERLPNSFGNLSRLQHINLSGCRHWERLPDSFGNLSMLEQIKLSWCSGLERLPDSFGNLSMLEHIDLSRCTALEKLPDSFGKLSRLQHIDLSGCGQLERLPDSFGNLIKLKYLNLSGCDKLTIPGGTFLKITLEDMTLPQWRMEVLPPQTVHQLSLKKVLLGFINLIEWPSAIGESSHVEKLVLETPFLETLPPSFGRGLRNLKYLELRSCRSLKRLPDSFLLLNQLIELTVEDCSLRELHVKAVEGESKTLTDSGGQKTLSNFESCLHRLQYLKMHKTQISEISFPTSVCPRLQHLEIRECRDLVEVGTLPDALIHLQLTGCPKLRKIERICGFPKLQTLDGNLCKEGEELPLMEDKSRPLTEWRGQRALSNLDSSFHKYLLRLQHLELHDVAISELSFPTDVCPNLQHLDIRECRDLVDVGTLPDALINLQLAGCPQLKKIERLFRFTELQTPYRRGQRTFSNLDPLFDKSMLSLQHLEPCITEISEVSFPKGVYPNLQYLSIKHGKSTVEFGKSSNGEFMKLEVLNCCKLSKIEQLCGLAKLQILNISSCEGVELSSMETSVSLEKLQVLGCPNLKSIHGLAHLTHIRELNVSGCSELEELPGLDHLISLETLLAGECVKLESIQGLARLTQLRELSVSGCSELQELPGLEHLTSLKKLSTDKCVKLKNLKGLEQLIQLLELNVSGCFELEEMPGVVCLQPLVELRL